MSAWWIIIYLILERLIELAVSHRNRARLLARGGREYYQESFRALAMLHVLFLISLVLESHPWVITLNWWNQLALGCFVLLQVGRYWCIWALGDNWNTRIIVVPGTTPVNRGPYRYLRHPNYLIVSLEFLVIPMLLHAPLTLAIFFIANVLLVRQRIRLEEEVLRRETRYGKVFDAG